MIGSRPVRLEMLYEKIFLAYSNKVGDNEDETQHRTNLEKRQTTRSSGMFPEVEIVRKGDIKLGHVVVSLRLETLSLRCHDHRTSCSC